MDGFKNELDGRVSELKANRVELERLYALRVDDKLVDEQPNAQYKEDAMRVLRMADSAFTSLSGSVRSIKSVIEYLAFA